MKTSGPWPLERMQAHLESSRIPLRLAAVARSGHPVVASLWFVWREGAVWCATSPGAHVVSMLAREPRCGFEVARDAPPYQGVRGRGRATLDHTRGAEILGILIDRYLGSRDSSLARWLLARSADEVAIRIDPERLASWDYTERMR